LSTGAKLAGPAAALAPVAIRAGVEAVKALTPAARLERKQYKADVNAMASGNLGPSQSAQNQMAANALRQARASQRAAQANAASALAAGAPGGGAQGTLSAMKEGAVSDEAMGQMTGQIAQAAGQQAAQEKERVMGEVAAKKAKQAQTIETILGIGTKKGV
tara:strand:+ start:147 stop:629 length:483 start_codon:yes stop_codon:yes gene_type:complete